MRQPIRRLAFVALVLLAVAPSMADEPVRRTATVKLVEKCLPATVALNVIARHYKTGEMREFHGSGTIIHSAGYVLTNDHVVQHDARITAILSDGREVPCHTVAQANYEDVAVAKIDAEGPFPALPLGRSNDLMLGEPVLTISNHALLHHSIATGIVSFVSRPYWTEELSIPDMIQASISGGPGISGAPLINALGEHVGIISSGKWSEGITFTIPIDRLRRFLPRLIAVEDRYQYRLGLEVDMLGPAARVTDVEPSSPAARAGVQIGDLVRKVDKSIVRQGVDFWLALVDRQPGETLDLSLERKGQAVSMEAVLQAVPEPKPASETAVVSGVEFAAYRGHWKKLPDFSALSPLATGRIDRPCTAALMAQGDGFGMVFTGFIRVPTDGLYVFNLLSVDGSRLYVRDRLVVDDDGQHPPDAVGGTGGVIRLNAGMHPIRLCYFSAREERKLAVFVQGPRMARQEVPASWFFVRDVKAGN